MEDAAVLHVYEDDYGKAVPLGKPPYSQAALTREVSLVASGIQQREPNVFLGIVRGCRWEDRLSAGRRNQADPTGNSKVMSSDNWLGSRERRFSLSCADICASNLAETCVGR